MKRWIIFVNRKDWQSSSLSYICIKHVEKKYYKKKIKNGKRYRLAMNMKPFTAILDPKKTNNKHSEINNVTSPICIPRRTPRTQEIPRTQETPRTQEAFISRRLIWIIYLKDSFESSHILMKVLRPIWIFTYLNESFTPNLNLYIFEWKFYAQFESSHIWMKILRPIGILLETMMCMSYLTS